MTTIRTRIAPSPTGDPHVGTAYVALFNYCFAKSQGGEFILRIEDTDQVRSTPESEQAILHALKWLGIKWSEGPDVGGPHAPYRQSERTAIYQQYAKELVDKGHAFYCFATSEELDDMRRAQQANNLPVKYDGRGLALTAEEVQKRLQAGEPYVIRMKVPEHGICKFNDLLRGEIEIPWEQVDMQVLMKADGLPTYHLANVVDDHLMQITHVIRGEEWINSAPKHILLYQYFGWQIPTLCHMPLLRNPDKSKLSKRKNPTSITYYERMGFLPEAVLNYLGRMGWSMPDEREKFTLQEMIEHFDIGRVSLGGPIFDIEKLKWLNGEYIRHDLTDEQFLARLQTWAFNREYIDQIIPHIKTRVEVFSDVVAKAGFLFSGALSLSESSFDHAKLSTDDTRKILQFALWRLEALRTWNKDVIFAELKVLADKLGFKVKDFLSPLFVAMAGTTSSISVVDSMQIIGADITRTRIRVALEVLGGVSKNQTKEFEKEYAQL